MSTLQNTSAETEPDTPAGSAAPAPLQDDEAFAFVSAAEQPEIGLLAEFLLFLREHKAWWMAPILIALLLLGLVAFLSSTAAAPFIYPLF